MNPIKLIRKLGKTLRGGATFRQVFLGVFLGFAVGMTPGVNLTLFVLIALFLLMNINGAMGTLALMLGKILCHVLAPLTFQIAYAMVHSLGLLGLVQWMADTPVLALMDWQVYCLIGGLPIIILGGGALAIYTGRSMAKVRQHLAAATDKSGAYRKLGENKLTKLLMRIVFGKQKTDFADMVDDKGPLFRKGRLIGGAVVLAVVVALPLMFMNRIATFAVVKGLAAANGAEVTVESVSLSAGGKLVVTGLQVTDRQRPTHNSVQAERLEADVSVLGLLTRRVVIDVLSCEGVMLDGERATPGEVFQRRDDDAAEPFQLPTVGGEDLQNAKKTFDRINGVVEKLSEHLSSDDPSQADAEARRRRLADEARVAGYLRLSAKGYLAKRPAWVIREASFPVGLYGSDLVFTLTARNISSHPSLLAEPATFELDKKALAGAIIEGITNGGGLGDLFRRDDSD